MADRSDRVSYTNSDRQLISDALRYPGTRVRVASNEDGDLVGCSMVLPVCRESLAILERHPMHAELTNTYFRATRRATLPTNFHDATAQYLLPVLAAGDQMGAARCALFRELAAIFSSSAVYLCMNREPAMNALLRECNFELVTEQDPAKGWVLDLSHIGFEGWIQAVVDGRRAQAPTGNAELETEILSALTHWDDAAWLAAHSRLVGDGVPPGERAEVARQAISDAFTRARLNGAGSCDAALRALELGYIKKTASRKQAMRSLSVSKATFYRLCKRGAGALAEHVRRP